MKNREKIKEALLLSLQAKIREECKQKGYTKKITEETVLSTSQYLEQCAEVILQEYDGYLVNILSNELTARFKENIENENKVVCDQLYKLTGLIKANHINVNKGLTSLSIFHKLIREKVLEEEIDNLESEASLLKNHKSALQQLAKVTAKKTSWLFVVLLLSSLIVWCFLIYKFGWNSMEKWTYISALFLIFLNGLYFAVFERNFTSESLRKDKLTKAIQHAYHLYKFDESTLNKIEQQLKTKKEELGSIKNDRLPSIMVGKSHAS